MHEDVVAAVGAAHHEVVTGARCLVGADMDRARARRDQRRPLGGEDVLAAVGAPATGSAEAPVLRSEAPGALDGKDGRAGSRRRGR